MENGGGRRLAWGWADLVSSTRAHLITKFEDWPRGQTGCPGAASLASNRPLGCRELHWAWRKGRLGGPVLPSHHQM